MVVREGGVFPSPGRREGTIKSASAGFVGSYIQDSNWDAIVAVGASEGERFCGS